MTIRVPDPPPLPEEIARIIQGKPDLESSSTQLSMYRTRLSTYRTHVSNLRSHLSNERTHLSYLRTAISLIGFGVTLNKFSQYLIEQHKAPSAPLPLRDTGYVGLGMAVLGLLMLAWSLYRFWKVSADIERGEFVPRYRVVIAASLGLLLIGGGTVLWLFLF
jgi:putative membrane protein